jgi:hypothetical protein
VDEPGPHINWPPCGSCDAIAEIDTTAVIICHDMPINSPGVGLGASTRALMVASTVAPTLAQPGEPEAPEWLARASLRVVLGEREVVLFFLQEVQPK